MSAVAPYRIGDTEIMVARAAVPEILADSAKEQMLLRASTSFRAFLEVWSFRDGERRRTAVLGESLWSGQQRVVEAMEEHELIIAPKSRKTGLSTLACAYAGWVLRFEPDSVVSCISYRIDASMKLRDQVLYGLQRLPEYMRLPTSSTKTTITLTGAGHLEAWPATERAQADISSSHTLVDELGRWIAPNATWQALQPSIAGTCHVVSTSPGPESFMADLYRRSEAGDTGFVPVFVGALDRPDRDNEWYAAQQRALGPGLARVEYPRTVDDVLRGNNESFFDSQAIDLAVENCIPPEDVPHIYQRRRPRHWEVQHSGRWDQAVFDPVFTIGVDVGQRDAFVAVVLEHSTDITDVVGFVRKTGLSYSEMAAWLTELRRDFHRAHVAVESNNAGSALIEMLPFNAEGRWTSARSKTEGLYAVQARLAEGTLTIPGEYTQLTGELRNYSIPDDHLVQDSVMALMVALQASYERPALGRVLSVIQV